MPNKFELAVIGLYGVLLGALSFSLIGLAIVRTLSNF